MRIGVSNILLAPKASINAYIICAVSPLYFSTQKICTYAHTHQTQITFPVVHGKRYVAVCLEAQCVKAANDNSYLFGKFL